MQSGGGWKELKNGATSFLDVQLKDGGSDVVSAVHFDDNSRKLFEMRPLHSCAVYYTLSLATLLWGEGGKFMRLRDEARFHIRAVDFSDADQLRVSMQRPENPFFVSECL